MPNYYYSINVEYQRYYHISNVQNRECILAEGVLGNEDGEVYVFSELTANLPFYGEVFIADLIAQNQLGIVEYDLYEIEPAGVTGEVLSDNVGELSANYQWIIQQAVIQPIHIRYVESRQAGKVESVLDKALRESGWKPE